ncbi:GcrA family cell cycle regulator [Bradyrhizobium sp. USDA 4350]
MEHVEGWSDDRAELAKRLFLNGSTGSEIAAELGGGLTRSAVMGKLARMGVKRPRVEETMVEAKKRTPVPKPPRSPKPARPDAPAQQISSAAAASRPVAIGERGLIRAVETAGKNTCKAPIGDPALDDFQFCGQPCEGPYCSFHGSHFMQIPLRRHRAA